MTQMLLFDAASTDTSAVPFATTAPVVAAQPVATQPVTTQPVATQPVTDTVDALAADPVAADHAAALNGNEPGLHAMGDLARLVLLRYDLMAARRAKRAK